MAQDYNFYIHYTTEIIDNNKTKPKPQPQPKPQPTPSVVPQDTFKPIHVVAKGTNFAKVGVGIIGTIVSSRIVDKTLTFASELMAGYNGNYELQHNRSNFKALTSTILNPLSIVERNVRAEMQRFQELSKKEQDILLTGNDFMKGS